MTAAPDFRSMTPLRVAPAAASDESDPPISPHVVEPNGPDETLEGWFAAHDRAVVDALVSRAGAVLFRGFGPEEDVLTRLGPAVGEPMPYVVRSTRRTRVAPGVYTSTEYPASHAISPHSENAYQADWPARLLFHAVTPARAGGATVLVDNAQVYESIGADVRDELVARRITYVRNLGGGLELPWHEVFQTSSRSAVEMMCSRQGMAWRWKDRGRLRISQVLPAALLPPGSDRPVWFNQAHLFHPSNLAPPVAAGLREAVDEDDLPRNALFGDGGAIPRAHLEEVRAAYARHAVRVAWQAGDVLLVDNVAAAHGRDPFVGERRILVVLLDQTGHGRHGRPVG